MLAISLAGTTVSPACQCPPQRATVPEFLRSSDVFLGRVSEVLYETPRTEWGYRRIARFDIFQTWKGTRADTVSVETATGFGDCGSQYRTGWTYIVYGVRDSSGVLHTSRCSRTSVIERAAEDLAALGPAQYLHRVDLPPSKTKFCPVHKIELRELDDVLVLNMPAGTRARYFAWAEKHAPLAELRIDEASESSSSVLACTQCRKDALEWPGVRDLERAIDHHN